MGLLLLSPHNNIAAELVTYVTAKNKQEQRTNKKNDTKGLHIHDERGSLEKGEGKRRIKVRGVGEGGGGDIYRKGIYQLIQKPLVLML